MVCKQTLMFANRQNDLQTEDVYLQISKILGYNNINKGKI